MITAVLDTNLLASGLPRSHPDAAPAKIIDAWRNGLFVLAVSEPILEELRRTFGNRYFSARVPKPLLKSVMDMLESEAVVTPIVLEGASCRHFDRERVRPVAIRFNHYDGGVGE
ncbi:MAG: PIN domain-containing protein, partial [SAR202 cluster bacterium]|nr:PIN domain-containing protein [SAR202 cluster bacterium]